LVEHHWKFRDETHAKKLITSGFQYIILNEATDKQQLRQMLVKMMYDCEHPTIIKQYVRCIKNIARLDYPERWPTLLSYDIPTLLNMDGEKAVYTGLLAL